MTGISTEAYELRAKLNYEVFTLLADIRSLILTGEILHVPLTTERPVGGAR